MEGSWKACESHGVLMISEACYNGSDAAYDPDGSLLDYGTNVFGSTYIISKDKILIGEEGLKIINDFPLTQIVFRSDSDIVLLGSISVYNAPAELVFVGSTLYCNACNFPGVDSVTFSIIANAMDLSHAVLANNPAKYSNKFFDDNIISIGTSGMYSSGTNFYFFASSLNSSGLIHIKDMNLQVKNYARFDEKVTVNNLIGTGSEIVFKEFYARGDVDVIARIWNASYVLGILGNGIFNVGSYFIPNALEKHYIGGNLNVTLTSADTKLIASAKGDITVISDYPIVIENIVSSKSIKVKSESNISVYNSKANIGVMLFGCNNIYIYKTLETPGYVNANSKFLFLHGVMNAGKEIKVIVDDSVLLDKSGAKMFSQGTLIIENRHGKPIEKIHIRASQMISVGNAIIRAKLIILERDGKYEVKWGNKPFRVDPKRDIGWRQVGFNDCISNIGNVVCWMEEVVGDLGRESKLIIGNDLAIEADKIDNRLSKLQVTGITIIIGRKPEIHNSEIKLKIKGTVVYYLCYQYQREEFANWANSIFIAYCNIKISDDNKIRSDHMDGRNPTLETSSYSSEKYQISVTELEHSNLSSNDLENSDISEVVIEGIEISLNEQNINQRTFWQDRLSNLANQNRLHGIFPNDAFEHRRNESFLFDLSLDNQVQDKSETFEGSDGRVWQELVAGNKDISQAEFQDVANIVKQISVIEREKKLDTWQEQDVLSWKVDKERIWENIAEVIAVIKRTVFLNYRFYPRLTQIISVLMLCRSVDTATEEEKSLMINSDGGRLAEIGTGEGKSIIIAIFAAVKVLEGHTVDIITSSPILAQRDYEEQRKFYGILGISSAENISEIGDKEKDCYKKDIVYGTITSFIGDILRQTSLGINILYGREPDVVAIDEVDNMFIDQSSHIVMLSRQLSRFEYLEPLLVAIWERLLLVRSSFYYNEDRRLMWAQYVVNGEDYQKVDEVAVDDEDVVSFIEQKLSEYVDLLITGADPIIKTPAHLKDFVTTHVNDWIRSALTAYNLQLDHDYVYKKQDDGDLDIAPLDRKNTGMTQSNMQWSNGVHQFLQIKHNLKISPEAPIVDFMSNKAFFEQYKGNIYGMTGTIGAENEKLLLAKLYGVDFVSIPTFKLKNLKKESMRIVNSAYWEEEVVSDTILRARNGKAVLLIAETVAQAERFYNKILDSDYPNDKVRLYSKMELNQLSGLSWFVDVGDIVVSTNLSSRGVDFKTNDVVEDRGGLHVCVSYLPDNNRLVDQMYGRTCRGGNSGSVQMIIDAEYTVENLRFSYPWYEEKQKLSPEDIITWRDLAYKQKMLRDSLCGTEMLTLKDSLFKEFNQFSHQFKDVEKKHQYNPELQQIKELWGLWLENQNDLMKCNIQTKLDENSDFRERNDQIKREILANYKKFGDDIITRHGKNLLIVNPSYLIPRALTMSSLSDADRAVSLDPNFSFPAEYIRANILILNQNREKAKHSLEVARNNIENVILPLYQLPLHLLGHRDLTYVESPLALQFRDKTDIIFALLENINDNIRVLEAAGNTGRETHLTVEFIISLEKTFPDHKRISDELNEFSMLGIDNFFEAGYYFVPEKQSSFGNFFAIAFGIFQIVVGFVLPGSGVFLTALQASLMVGGIKDAIMAMISTMQGKLIDIKNYMKSKVIDLAITVLMAGVEAGVSKLGLSKTLGFQSAESGKINFKTQFARQAKLTLITSAIEGVMNFGLREFQNDIESGIRKRVYEELHSHHQKEILKIAVMDEWVGGRAKGRLWLVSIGRSIMARYGGRYEQMHQQVLRNIGGRVPVLAGPLIAFDMAATLAEVLKITDDFCKEFGSNVINFVPKDEDLLLASLGAEQKINRRDGYNLVIMMEKKRFIESGRFVGMNVTSIEETDFGVYNSKKANVSASYDNVSRLESAESEELYRDAVDRISREVSASLSKEIIGIVRSGIIAPLAGISGSYFLGKIEEIQKEQQKEQNAKLGKMCDEEGVCWSAPFKSAEAEGAARRTTGEHGREPDGANGGSGGNQAAANDNVQAEQQPTKQKKPDWLKTPAPANGNANQPSVLCKGVGDGKLTKLAEDTKKLKAKYDEFARDYPKVAEYTDDALVVAPFVIKGAVQGAMVGGALGAVTGPGALVGGLAGGARGAAQGFAQGMTVLAAGNVVSYAFGEEISLVLNKAVDVTVPMLMKADNTLTAENAQMLLQTSISLTLTASDLVNSLKNIGVARALQESPRTASGMSFDDYMGHNMPDTDTNLLFRNQADGGIKVDTKHSGELRYKDADYHHHQSQGLKGVAPKNPEGALKDSIKLSDNTDRRVGYDYKNNEIVVFDNTMDNTYHGHVRNWNELTQDMKNALVKEKVFDYKGRLKEKK